ncbi:MAG: DUF6279 family lipoprotein [Pseudomonadota bacterium]
MKKPRYFRGYRSRAERIVNDPGKLRDLVQRVSGKLGTALESSDRLRGVADELKLMVDLLRAWVSGEYRGISQRGVLGIVASLLYFLVPLDGIPDSLLGLGFIDDVAVITFVFQQLKSELDAFRHWRSERSRVAAAVIDGDTDTAAPLEDRSALPAPESPGQRNRSPWAVGLVALLVTLVLSGCSLKLAYNNADRLIRWGLSDFIDLTDEQRRFLDDELDRILYWHRTTQLPIYASYLDQLNARIDAAAGKSPEVLLAEIERFGVDAEQWGKAVEGQARRLVLQMLLSMTAEQIARLPETIAKANEEFAEDEAGKSMAESQAQWAKDYADFFKRFTGRLNDAQRATLTTYSQRYEPHYDLWVDYRSRWQTELLGVLKAMQSGTATVEETEARILAMDEHRESYYGEFGPAWEKNEALAQEAAAAVLVSLTARQRQRLNDRVRDITDDLRELVAEADATAPAALAAGDCLVAVTTCPGPRGD